jgi:glycogen phosphorylase
MAVPKEKQPVVAYFSAEYAIADALPTYAGGLGVLAGDLVQQAGDDDRELIAFGPAYRHNVAVKTNHNEPLDQQMADHGFHLVNRADGQVLVVELKFASWKTDVRVWERKFGTSARLLLLDTDFPPNTAINRNLMANLYDPDLRTRLQQQFLLAMASLKVLGELDIAPDVYHLNEGHMALVVVALALEYAKHHPGVPLAKTLVAVSEQVVATKHTILPGAGDFAELEVVRELFGSVMEQAGFSADELFEAGRMPESPETFSTTRLLLATARAANGVSAMHCVAERAAHPHSQLIPITNGVYAPRWQHHNLGGRNSARTSGAELWRLHEENRAGMIEHVNRELGTRLDPERLTVVWARRFASYKRPTLVLSDVVRLAKLLNDPERPLQVIISGNANESDVEGIMAVEAITAAVQREEFGGRLAYWPHYVTETTKWLAGGADLWLNTPIRGMEACGTSGMKASLNGAVQLSTSDGWFDEIEAERIGWILPEEDSAGALYELLEHEVVPLFYARGANGLPEVWLAKLRAALELMERQFTAHRMLDDYYDKLYTRRPAHDRHA